jgi:hypothetical protein
MSTARFEIVGPLTPAVFSFSLRMTAESSPTHSGPKKRVWLWKKSREWATENGVGQPSATQNGGPR